MEKTKEHEDVQEQAVRALHALLASAMAYAFDQKISLAYLKRAVEHAYFDLAAERVPLIKDLSALMSVSMSKIGLLSRQRRSWFLPKQPVPLMRRVEYMLATGPMTMARLNQMLPKERFVALERALKGLEAQGRIEEIVQQATVAWTLVLRQDISWDLNLLEVQNLKDVNQPLARMIPALYASPEHTQFEHVSIKLLDKDMDAALEILNEARRQLRRLGRRGVEDKNARTFEVSIMAAPTDQPREHVS